ncbi:MAG: hypothetical protein H0Z19_08440 [Archaeoglobus sp.]|uniref:hypothetical protein n=1 Tax=Archaeoglobus sp. TaxID=1872626 RepID=UPI001D33BE8E|nr:hypothetical protein [Archaeoglobus sp.]MBO8180488.1 hypothetical protein [Archaeoglobus sp.]
MTMEALAAIGCITLMELYALKKGHNGQLLRIVIAIVAGLAGFEVRGLLGI